MIRVFEGARHDRLRALWDTIAEFCHTDIRLNTLFNPGARLSHGEAFNRIWRDLNGGERYVLFTEHDYLPNLHDLDWTRASELSGRGLAMFACEYATRAPDSKQIVRAPSLAGGWFILLDRDAVPYDMDFRGTPDPGNQLPAQLQEADIPFALARGRDAYPLHYGLEYPFGTHLFWSRHYHDDPARVVSGFRLGDIQNAHDYAVRRWFRRQPPEFQALFRARFPSISSESFSECIEKPATCGASSSN